MSYFNENTNTRIPFPWLRVALLMVVAAIIGGFISLYIADKTDILGQQADTAQLSQQSEQTGQGASSGGDSGSTLDLMNQYSSISEIAKNVSPSVVCITNIGTTNSFGRGSQDVEQGTGSGVIISKDGYIVTNNHVVSGASKLVVNLADGRELTGKLIGTDARSDLAVIKIDADNLSAATLGDSDKIQVGELAMAIGNPGGAEFARSLTVGVVSGINRMLATSEGQQYKLIQTDAAINPGNSGGALVDANGQVIGINSVKIASTEYEGMGFAIPSNTVKEITSELIKNGKVIRPALGVGILGDLSPEIAEYNGFKIDYGVIVIPGSLGPAARAGMKAYDIIIAIDGEKITSSYQLQEIIFGHKVGDKVNVKVMRDDKELTFSVTLGELSQ